MRTVNEISGAIVDAALKVHSALGPGLLEKAYEVCLVHELQSRGLNAVAQVPLPVVYDGLQMDAGYRLDVLVENTVVIELKAVDGINPLHEAQVLTYLKLSGKPLGLLLNFNVIHMRDGIKRIAHRTLPQTDVLRRETTNPQIPPCTSVSSVSSVVDPVKKAQCEE
ncbi:MAG TPA: GxxExxY protein [Armatimonadota bacterium]|jgi:GxxExxY protein